MVQFYHVRITAKSDPSTVEVQLDLSLEQLTSRFVEPYGKGAYLLVNGRSINATNVERIQINRSYHNSTRVNAAILAQQRARNTIMGVDLRGRLPASILAESGEDVTDEFITGPPGYAVDEGTATIRQLQSSTAMRIFISHSSNDTEIAGSLIDLLRKALPLQSDDIRCTSVDGYRMPGGASIDERLRTEVHGSELLIGLITPNSLGSAYVIFELGARWGAERPMIPLLASGVTPEHLEGPLAGINALDSRDDGQVYQLLEDAAGYLQVPLDKTSSYAAEVGKLTKLSSELTAISALPPSRPASPQLSEDAGHLLIEAAKSSGGEILRARPGGGLVIQANGRNLCERGNPRSEARWNGALEELVDYGLVNDPTGKSQVFEVTHKGFEIADSLGTS